MRNKYTPSARTVEEEISSLNDLGLSAEEKIAILELMMQTAWDENDRDIIKQAADAIAVDKFILGQEDR
jgi:hypothetical protein